MFSKPFRVKTCAAVKSSDRKKWKCRFENVFHLTTEELDQLIPSKSEVTVAKIETFGGDVVTAYCAQKNPYFFEVDGDLFPTVYTLWKFPNLIKTFTTWPQVLPKITGGADLMLPGVVLSAEESAELTPRSYGKFEKGTICCVNLTDNKAAVAVGRTAHSSMDMFMAARRGKAVNILHFYSDYLWEFGDRTVIPTLGPAFTLESKDESNFEVTTTGAEDICKETEALSVSEEKTDSKENEEVKDEVAEKLDKTDEILIYTFKKSLKSVEKDVTLPLLCSTFYKTLMMPNCPSGFQLDVKKSSFKKLSKFLNHMQEEGYVQVKELTKGVESITAINYKHEDLKSFVIDANDVVEKVETNSEDVFLPPVLEEIYFVTADVLPLFSLYNYRKGSNLTGPEIRELFRQYVADKNLKCPNDKSLIAIDEVLGRIVNKFKEATTMDWNQAMQLCIARMTSGTRVSTPGQEPRIIREKLQPIEITVAKRAANKTVTLVTNLEMFGIDPHRLAHTIQVRVATSTAVNPAPNKKEGSQVLIQGNQVHHLSKLLLDELKLPKRYVKGLELAKKKK